MTIKYKTSAAFRNSFVDENGLPLTDGKLFSYKASDHGCEKAIYQSDIITPPATEPPAYTNPIVLDAGGSVPPPGALFFADDEQYFLKLTKSDGTTVVATWDNWPPESQEPTPPADEIDVTNFFGNADFSQQIKSEFVEDELGATSDTLVATPNWYYARSNLESTINIKFEKFLLGQTDVPDNPYSYYHYECSGIGAGGETYNDFKSRISDVRTFSNETITISIYGRSIAGSQIEVLLSQYFGASGSTIVNTNIGTITLTSEWTEYTITATVPSIAGKTIDPERGCLDVIFRNPLSTIADVQLTHFQLNKGDALLEYQYLPEQFNTGKNFSLIIPPYPTQRYFKLDGSDLYYDWRLEYNTQNGWEWVPPLPAGTVIEWATETPPDGWLERDKAIHTPSSFPRLFAAIGASYGSYYATATVLTDVVTVTNKNDGVVTDAAAGTSGFTVTVTQQGTAVLPEIFTVETVAGSSITTGSYFTFSTAAGGIEPAADWAVVLLKDNIGILPALIGKSYVVVHIDSINTAEEVAAKINAVMNPVGFVVGDMRGFFARTWNHGNTGEGVDPDAATRIDRGDGTVGDNIGTVQSDEFKSHNHSTAAFADFTYGAGTSTRSSPLGTTTTGATGGSETRPKNRYVMKIIKY